MIEFTELSICTDCLMMAANGECGERDERAPEPLSLHDGYVIPGDEDYGFRQSDCEGCGTYLHGDRHEAFIEI